MRTTICRHIPAAASHIGMRFPGVLGSPRRFDVLFAILLLLALSACSNRSVAIVDNRSTLPLTEVVLSGKGFSTEIGTLKPGERRPVVLDLPSSEHGLLVITFVANGASHRFSYEGYYEAKGYELLVLIRPDLAVETTVQLSPL